MPDHWPFLLCGWPCKEDLSRVGIWGKGSGLRGVGGVLPYLRREGCIQFGTIWFFRGLRDIRCDIQLSIYKILAPSQGAAEGEGVGVSWLPACTSGLAATREMEQIPRRVNCGGQVQGEGNGCSEGRLASWPLPADWAGPSCPCGSQAPRPTAPREGQHSPLLPGFP